MIQELIELWEEYLSTFQFNPESSLDSPNTMAGFIYWLKEKQFNQE